MISEEDQAIIASGQPYVYQLCYPNGEPFYIGKGRNGRAFQHIKEAENGYRSIKHKTIREIMAKGQEVFIKIDSVHDTDKQALQREQFLIFEHGCQWSKTGTLTNVKIKTLHTTKIKLVDMQINQNEKMDMDYRYSLKHCLVIREKTMPNTFALYQSFCGADGKPLKKYRGKFQVELQRRAEESFTLREQMRMLQTQIADVQAHQTLLQAVLTELQGLRGRGELTTQQVEETFQKHATPSGARFLKRVQTVQ
jgi:hypothetical protein